MPYSSLGTLLLTLTMMRYHESQSLFHAPFFDGNLCLLQVNKLIWPSPQGIGVHSKSGMVSTQKAALMSGVIEYTVEACCLLFIGMLVSPCFA